MPNLLLLMIMNVIHYTFMICLPRLTSISPARGTGHKNQPARYVIKVSVLIPRLNLVGFALVASPIPSVLRVYLYSGVHGMSVRQCSQS